MAQFPRDIYTEPPSSSATLEHLGPLTAMAGRWVGEKSLDVNPTASGPDHQVFIEHADLQPIDAQTNGPQLFYGLRYHIHIVKPDSAETFHDQVGYWLWEPATGRVIQTLSIPRGQTAMAIGQTAADARSFSLEAIRGSNTNGIVSNPFLDRAFRTDRYSITITIHDADTWSYAQETTLTIADQPTPFHHTDRNTLRRVSAPTPNPLALAAAPQPPR